jgi:hypothetical protein
MLLVALVALGSATYAWFTISKSVTADGMRLTAKTEAGLEITKNGGTDWDPTKVSFSANYDALKLVSLDTKTDNTLNGFFAGNVDVTGKWATGSTTITDITPVPTAQDVNAAVTAAGTATGDKTAATKYFAAYQVQVKSRADQSGTAVTRNNLDATVTIEGQGASYVRAAILDSTGAVKGTYVGATESNADAFDSTTSVVAQDQLKVSGADCDLADTIGSNAQTYTILCWFEGQDADAVNGTTDNSNKEATVSVKFKYAS